MKHLILILLLGVFQIIYGDLTKAYGLYLSGEFDSSYSYYDAEYEKNSENIEAVYGMINCDIARGKFDSALNMVEDAIGKHQNSILFSKLIYIYGRKNDTKNVLETFKSAKKLFPDITLNDSLSFSTRNELSDILYSAGCGFYDGKKYRTALQWFTKGDSLFKGVSLFRQAVYNTQIALKNQILFSTNANGGMIAYSSSAPYKTGCFFKGSLSALFNQIFRVKSSYIRTDIRFDQIYYGINYDTLFASRDGNPEESGYKVISDKVFTNIEGKNDTMYFVYTETKTSNSNTSFDTIVKYDPQNYYQNDYYLSFTDYGKFLKRTVITAGCRLSYTNMLNANHLNTFFIKHTTRLTSVSLGCSYYASFLDHDQIFQISPQLEIERGLFFSGLTVNAVSPTYGKAKDKLFDKAQLSSDLLFGLKYKTFKISVSGSCGSKKFLNSAEGEVMHNILHDYQYGFESIIEWTPRNKMVTLYQLFDYSRYAYNEDVQSNSTHFNKYVIMGGLYIQW